MAAGSPSSMSVRCLFSRMPYTVCSTRRTRPSFSPSPSTSAENFCFLVLLNLEGSAASSDERAPESGLARALFGERWSRRGGMAMLWSRSR